MADNSGRGYLPPTVPNPSNPHRRQWTVGPQAPPSFYSAPQPWPGHGHGLGPGHSLGPSHGHGPKPYLVHGGSSSPQSEGIDLTARPAGPPEPAHNGGDPVNGQMKEAAAGVSVIAPNPLVLPEEIKALDNSDGIGSKAPFERPTLVDFIAAESKVPVFPTASIPVSAAPESKGHPVHPLTSKLQEQAGIPTPFEGKGPPAESGGTPSHPVESKVSARPMEGGKPPDPLVAPSIPAAIPVEERQFMNPSLPQDEPSLPPVSVASLIVEPLPAPPAPPAPPPPIPFTSQVQAKSASTHAPAPSNFPEPSQPLNERGLPPSPDKVSASAAPVADHVESLLENMFQGGDESPVKQSVIVANTKAPALTDDKVVAILEDQSPVETVDVKPDVKSEPDKGNKFREVESELEKMFAGIVEDVEDVKPAVPTKAEPQPLASTQEVSKKRKRSVGKPRPRKSVDSDQPAVPAKRGRKPGAADKKGGKKPRHDKIKEASNDSSNLGGLLPKKGPYVYVEGPKENPSKICVVNSGSRDEEERDWGMDKSVARRKHQYVEGRLKGSGLYSSTLSSKYNAQNADLTWVCIFCKLRSNCERGLGGEPAGDLFGPYILTIPKDPDHESRDPKDSDVVAEQKRRGGGKQAASLRATGAVEQFVKESKKQLPVGEDLSGEREIWVHEKCAVWAPGVFLVGPHLIGLAEAVSAASVTKCSYCSHFGASLGCIVRNCPVRCHYGCAVATRWDLNYDSFIAKCPNHTRQIKS
uniref:Uncharacterized protein CG5098 n=1 Tax=Lygus hesperus TaxID=30085 RepID=A0A146M353_LYGHE